MTRITRHGQLVASAMGILVAALGVGCEHMTTGATVADAGPSDAGAAEVEAAASQAPESHDAGPDVLDAGPDVDNGARSTTYPAPHPEPPEVQSLGGPVLTTPKIVAVTFDGDALRSDIEAFVSKIGPSAYWKAISEEYGVGPSVAGTPIHLTEAAVTMTTSDAIEEWLIAKLDGTHPEWGTGDASTIYTLYYPATTLIDLQQFGKSCEAFGGYHAEVTLANGVTVPYAVMPRCRGLMGQTTLDTLTSSSSHEFIEAATDPFPYTKPAFGIPDPDHLVWARLPLPEVSDMCTYRQGSEFVPADLPFLVQRSWSNRAAKAGHNPCVPAAAGEAYAIAAPVLEEKVQISFEPEQLTTKGVRVPLGQERTIDIILFSDAPTSGPWEVSVLDAEVAQQREPELELHLDRSSGQNGEKLHLTIKRLKNGTFGGSEIIVFSRVTTQQINTWMGFVAN